MNEEARQGYFSDCLVTIWDKKRVMRLKEPFSYTDVSGKEWQVPCEAWLNGATIPRFLWSIIGAPYVGDFRRASVVHDYFVGEGDNPNVDHRARKKADQMFYEACLSDGCSEDYAKILYLGVSFGTWCSKWLPDKWKRVVFNDGAEYLPNSSIQLFLFKRFEELVDKMRRDIDMKSSGIEEVDSFLSREFEVMKSEIPDRL